VFKITRLGRVRCLDSDLVLQTSCQPVEVSERFEFVVATTISAIAKFSLTTSISTANSSPGIDPGTITT